MQNEQAVRVASLGVFWVEEGGYTKGHQGIPSTLEQATKKPAIPYGITGSDGEDDGT